MTALMTASVNGFHEVVRRLIDLNVDVNALHQDGSTALLGAAEEGHAAVVQLLLDAGANISSRNQEAKTAVMLAIEGGYTHIVEMIQKFIADHAKPTDNSFASRMNHATGQHKLRVIVEELVETQRAKTTLEANLGELQQNLAIVETQARLKGETLHETIADKQDLEDELDLLKEDLDNMLEEKVTLEQDLEHLKLELDEIRAQALLQARRDEEDEDNRRKYSFFGIFCG